MSKGKWGALANQPTCNNGCFRLNNDTIKGKWVSYPFKELGTLRRVANELG